MRPANPLRWVCNIVLAGACLAAAWRLAAWMTLVGTESLQMDFSCYYTAGKSVRYGLSPYLNHAPQHPDLWNGTSSSAYTGYLYPPLAAYLFAPLSLMPYAVAKWAWMIFSLLLVGLMLLVTTRLFPLRTWTQVLAVSFCTLVFQPLLFHLERGQIEALVGLLVTAAFLAFSRYNTRADFGGGALLALATLFKLHCIYLTPFLLWRRRWNALAGYCCGGIFLLVASVATPNGSAQLMGYALSELPRICRAERYQSPAASARTVPQQLWRGSRVVNAHGDAYAVSRANAGQRTSSLARALHDAWRSRGGDVSRATTSLLLFASFAGFGALWSAAAGRTSTNLGPQHEFLFWERALIVVFLTAPLTWAMALVALLPLAVVLASETDSRWRRGQAVWIGVTALGLLLVAVPDQPVASAFPALRTLVQWKYVIASCLLLAAISWRLRLETRGQCEIVPGNVRGMAA